MDQEKIEEIIEEKVEQRVEERVQEELEKRGVKDEETEDTDDPEEEISRRQFLKKAGMSAASLGALSLIPSTSALDFKDQNLNIQTGTDTSSLTDALNIDSSGNVQIPNGDLQLATGQAIEDGSANRRISLDTNHTTMRDETGSAVGLFGSNELELRAFDGSPIVFRDYDGSHDAVKYKHGNNNGTLELTNSRLIAKGDSESKNPNGFISASMQIDEDGNNYSALGFSVDAGAGASGSKIISEPVGNYGSNLSFKMKYSGGNATTPMILEGGLVDMSQDSADLRIATGQSIEDGGGNSRVSFGNGSTRLHDENGNIAIQATQNLGDLEMRPGAGSINRWTINDREGDFDAVTYKTSSSKPGTLELANSDLDLNRNNIEHVDFLSIDESNSGQYQSFVGRFMPPDNNQYKTTVTFPNAPSSDGYDIDERFKLIVKSISRSGSGGIVQVEKEFALKGRDNSGTPEVKYQKSDLKYYHNDGGDVKISDFYFNNNDNLAVDIYTDGIHRDTAIFLNGEGHDIGQLKQASIKSPESASFTPDEKYTIPTDTDVEIPSGNLRISGTLTENASL